jgi:predicted Fe-S protein YdhL (DUF1289 family)
MCIKICQEDEKQTCKEFDNVKSRFDSMDWIKMAQDGV